MSEPQQHGRLGVGKHQLTLSIEEIDHKRNKMSTSLQSDDEVAVASTIPLPNPDIIGAADYWKHLTSVVRTVVDESLMALTPRVDSNERKITDLEDRVKKLELTVSQQIDTINCLKTTVTDNKKTVDTEIKDIKSNVVIHDQDISHLYVQTLKENI